MVIPFFGILRPAETKPASSTDAPFKKAFFGGGDDAAPTRAEEDAGYLTGMRPEPTVRRDGQRQN